MTLHWRYPPLAQLTLCLHSKLKKPQKLLVAKKPMSVLFGFGNPWPASPGDNLQQAGERLFGEREAWKSLLLSSACGIFRNLFRVRPTKLYLPLTVCLSSLIFRAACTAGVYLLAVGAPPSC